MVTFLPKGVETKKLIRSLPPEAAPFGSSSEMTEDQRKEHVKQKREARAASRPASESQPCKTQLEALRLSRRAPRPALSLSRGMKVAEQCQARDSTSY